MVEEEEVEVVVGQEVAVVVREVALVLAANKKTAYRMTTFNYYINISWFSVFLLLSSHSTSVNLNYVFFNHYYYYLNFMKKKGKKLFKHFFSKLTNHSFKL